MKLAHEDLIKREVEGKESLSEYAYDFLAAAFLVVAFLAPAVFFSGWLALDLTTRTDFVLPSASVFLVSTAGACHGINIVALESSCAVDQLTAAGVLRTLLVFAVLFVVVALVVVAFLAGAAFLVVVVVFFVVLLAAGAFFVVVDLALVGAFAVVDLVVVVFAAGAAVLLLG